MSDNISRRIEQMVEKFCDDYCGSVDCANCGVSAERVTEFLKAERTGHWIQKDYYDVDWNVYECDQCGEPWQLETGTPKDNGMNFCPRCGAYMRGEGDERKQMGL